MDAWNGGEFHEPRDEATPHITDVSFFLLVSILFTLSFYAKKHKLFNFYRDNAISSILSTMSS